MELRSGKISVFDNDLNRPGFVALTYDDEDDLEVLEGDLEVLEDNLNVLEDDCHRTKIPVVNNDDKDHLCNTTEISMLNDYCLLHIFSYLPIMDRIRIQQVNKRWQKLSELKWHDRKILDLDLNKWSTNPIDNVMITSREIEKLLQLCGNYLTEINFGQDTSFQNSIQKQLHTIANEKFFSIIMENCTNLQSLNVSALVVTSGGINILANNCSNITKFAIGNCMDDVTENFSKFLKNARRLQFLGLSGADINTKCVSRTSTISIEILKLYKFHDYSRGSSSSKVFFRNMLRAFRNLRTLIVESCCLSQDDICEIIVSNTKKLEKLVLKCDYECSSFYRFETAYISGLSNLQEIELAHIKTIGDDVIFGIARHCKELLRVILHSLPITNSSIRTLMQLPKLEHLELRKMEKITDHAFIEAINLKTLIIYYCDRVENNYICQLLSTTVKMEMLYIYCCARIDVDDLIEFAASNIECKRWNGGLLNIYVKDKPLFVSDYYKSEKKVEQVSPYVRVTNLNK